MFSNRTLIFLFLNDFEFLCSNTERSFSRPHQFSFLYHQATEATILPDLHLGTFLQRYQPHLGTFRSHLGTFFLMYHAEVVSFRLEVVSFCPMYHAEVVSFCPEVVTFLLRIPPWRFFWKNLRVGFCSRTFLIIFVFLHKKLHFVLSV